MSIRNVRPRTAPDPVVRRAFTLIELIVVIAIIGLLMSVLIPAVRGVRRNAVMTREMGTARQLMVAYRSYAYDHDGWVLPGYDPQGDLDLVVEGPDGQDINDQVNAVRGSYVWRLAPWLDYDLDGLYTDKRLIERLVNDAQYSLYLPAVYPALGLNTFFVGGDGDEGEAWETGITDYLGQFFVTRLSQVTRPQRLLTFASARVNDLAANYVDVGLGLVEGYFRVKPPRFTAVQQDGWAGNRYVPDCHAPACDTRDFGFLSLRHPGRTAVIGFFDGHTDTLGELDLQDMRHWSHQATTPDWEVPVQQGP